MEEDSLHDRQTERRRSPQRDRNFIIGRKRLLQDVQLECQPNVSIGVQLAKEIDKFQNVLARNR